MPRTIIVGPPFATCEDAFVQRIEHYLDGPRDRIIEAFSSHNDFVLGQGLSHDLVDKLNNALHECGISHKFSLPQWMRNLCNKSLVHKANDRNVIISNPDNLTDDEISCDLWIDQVPDILADHVTGVHIPGIVIIEASRQLLVAGCELIGKHNMKIQQLHTRIILCSCKTHFYNYVYPVKARLSATGFSAFRNSNNAYISISISQGGKLAAKVDFDTRLRTESRAFEVERIKLHELNLSGDYA